MRWGVETSFRHLKYSIGLLDFHSKKVDAIEMEVWARLILYNYSRVVTNQITKRNILYITEYDYVPYGASVNVLTSDNQINNKDICAHLDKSHISVHTYPEIGKDSKVSYIRIDLEISTCGNISPLNSLSLIVDYFNPDVLIYDFVIRGVTRSAEGKKIYTCDDCKKSIKKFNKTQLGRYHVVNRYRNNSIEINMLKRRKEFGDYINRKRKINRQMYDKIYIEAKKIFLRRQ